MNRNKIEKASRDLLTVVEYFRTVPVMIEYLPENAQNNMRDLTIRIIAALEDLNEFINDVNLENRECTYRN